jgi:hypothetical protein
MNKLNKFRASYSNLSKWQAGQYDEFVTSYFHLEPSYTSREMAAGKEYHKEWEKYVNKYGKLPEVFGGKKLSNPVTEKKIKVEVEDWLDFVFICDCYQDNGEFIDFKTGVQNSGWDTQLGTQAVGLTLAKIKASIGHIYHYNQYTKKAKHDIIWITDQLLSDSLNWIVTLSSEAHNYLTVNNLYERFKNEK